MKTLHLLLLVLSLSCSTPKEKKITEAKKDYFAGMRGCFLLFNMKSGEFEKVIGESCHERFPACSTFKVPLAVMAFDAGILKDETQKLKWDGKEKMLDAWEQDHDARTWMLNSVVWFSQRLTPKLGERKFKSYLKKFNYGNQDISTGITTAWLNAPNDPRGALKISAYEQVEFMNKLWTHQLPVSKRSMELTQSITSLAVLPKGFVLHGKTGSNFLDNERKIRFGWFIAHVSNGDKQYIAVTNFTDLKPVQTDVFGGAQSRKITMDILADSGLW